MWRRLHYQIECFDFKVGNVTAPWPTHPNKKKGKKSDNHKKEEKKKTFVPKPPLYWQ